MEYYTATDKNEANLYILMWNERQDTMASIS